jgi:ABC-2 type transport system ATP-binding protein
LSTTGGSGPATGVPGSAGPLAAAVAPITPAKATNAVNVTVGAPARAALVVGAPTLTLTYHGLSATGGPVATSIYAQVVDDPSGRVLGNQVTPIPVTLDGATHTTTLPLEILSATDRPGEHFTVQVVASTVAYQTQRATGAIDFSRIHVALPSVNPAAAGAHYRRPNPAAS